MPGGWEGALLEGACTTSSADVLRRSGLALLADMGLTKAGGWLGRLT